MPVSPEPASNPRGTLPLVLVTEDVDAVAVAWLAEHCDVAMCAVGEPEFPDLLARAVGLVVRTYTRVDAELLSRAPRLRVVGRAGVGLDNIDVAACRSRGVEVVHTPDANTQAVAEYVIALLLDVLRPRERVTRGLTLAEWTSVRRGEVARRQLSELRLGIIGLGRVGTRVARAACGLGMAVQYHDLLEIAVDRRHGARPISLDDLLRTSDVVSVHVDARSANRSFLNAARIALLRADAIVINTSRGFVVDATALADFLNTNPSATALMDVHDPEPFGGSYPLLRCPNAHLYPHLGAATTAAHTAMSWVVRDVWQVVCGEKPARPAP